MGSICFFLISCIQIEYCHLKYCAILKNVWHVFESWHVRYICSQSHFCHFSFYNSYNMNMSVSTKFYELIQNQWWHWSIYSCIAYCLCTSTSFHSFFFYDFTAIQFHWKTLQIVSRNSKYKDFFSIVIVIEKLQNHYIEKKVIAISEEDAFFLIRSWHW